jgi:hypothetical protein
MVYVNIPFAEVKVTSVLAVVFLITNLYTGLDHTFEASQVKLTISHATKSLRAFVQALITRLLHAGTRGHQVV